jgi:hypothetical protein
MNEIEELEETNDEIDDSTQETLDKLKNINCEYCGKSMLEKACVAFKQELYNKKRRKYGKER